MGWPAHYLAAHANAAEGPEADTLASQARIALDAAAARAVDLGASDQALRFLEQALSVTTDPAEAAVLLERAGEAASTAARHELAEAHLRNAVDAQRRLGDRPATVRAMAALGRVLLTSYRPRDAIEILGPGADEFADLDTDPRYVALLGQLARAHFLDEDQMRAIEVADRALGAAERADLQPIVADTLVTKGSALAFVGRAIEGLGLIATGQAVAVANGLNRTALRAAANSASIERTRDPRAAFVTARTGLALARRIGARSVVVVMVGNLAASGVRTGDWSLALAELEATLTEEVETVDRITLLEAAIGIRAMRGDSVGDLLAEISAIGGSSTESVALASILHARANVAFAEGRLGDARLDWQRGAALIAEYLPTSLAGAARAALWSEDAAGAADSLAALDGSGFHGPAIEADRKTIRAGIAALEGRAVDALALYREALRAWRDLGVAVG